MSLDTKAWSNDFICVKIFVSANIMIGLPTETINEFYDIL